MRYFSLIVLFFSFAVKAKIETAIFAGGCFWCIQKDFDQNFKKGIINSTVGYDGGIKQYPTYEDVSSGKTKYLEVVKIKYDSNIVGYEKLLNFFFRQIDPYDDRGQFCDKGLQYTSAIFYLNNRQYKLAKKILAETDKLNESQIIKTKILKSTTFYPAESYHQKYYKKNPVKYQFYRWKCGRDDKLKDIWGNSPLK